MAYTIGVMIFLLGVIISIALHEVGHMVPAKRFGVKVPRYMIGFGPTLWSRKRGETEYGIKAFPLGGYVKLVGMIPPASEVKPVKGTGWAARLIEDSRATAVEEIEPGEEHRAFYRLVWWKRVIVMFGGPGTNLLIGLLLLTVIGLAWGAPTTPPTVVLTVDSVATCMLPAGADRDCTYADPLSASVAAGLKPGDRIVAIDGTAVEAWTPLYSYIRAHPGKTVTLDVVRDDTSIVLVAHLGSTQRPTYDDNGAAITYLPGKPVLATVGYLGVVPTEIVVRQGPFWGVVTSARYFGAAGDAIVHLPQSVYHATRAAFGMEARDPNGVASIVGAGRFAGEISSAKNTSSAEMLMEELQLIALINLALFLFNMIPLLPLDGGHIAGALWQGLKDAWAKARRLPHPHPVDLARTMPATYVMFILLMGMGLLLIYADIVAPVSIA